MSLILNHSLIAAVLVVAAVTLLIVFRGRLRTAANGNIISAVSTFFLVAAVLVANALLRTYVY